jgi:hypothetical protein
VKEGRGDMFWYGVFQGKGREGKIWGIRVKEGRGDMF